LAEGDELGCTDFPQIASQLGRAVATPADALEGPIQVAAEEVALVLEPLQSDQHPGLAPALPFGSAEALPLLDPAGEVRPLEELEAAAIRFAISHYRGQMSEVARRLRIGRSTLYRKLETLGLSEPEGEGDADTGSVAAG
jgi:DNA-binding NtrC family response regulator